MMPRNPLAAPRRSSPPVVHWQRLAAEPARIMPPMAGSPSPTPAWSPAPEPQAFTATRGAYQPSGGHPFADPGISDALRRQTQAIDAAFARIEPTLLRLAPRHYDEDFPQVAVRELRQIGIEIPPSLFAAHVMAPLNMRFLQARCVIGTFCRLIREGGGRQPTSRSDGEDAATLIRQWGFHAIDVSPCADGRLSGLLDHILRIPPAVVAYRESSAGALFNITEGLRHWEAVEVRRWRDGRPNPASEPTAFLKIGVYHFSSADPWHQGCAAHGSDTGRAAGALLERLDQFAQSVRNVHGAAAGVATLLVGVDTDTDSIRVHVPDPSGRMAVDRYVDSLKLYGQTASLSRDAAKEAVRAAVADCAGVGASDRATEGMRWFCGYLVKNNIAQVDVVQRDFGGRYKEAGHTERLIVVGDAVDDMQLRNLAFQAQMETVEEGAADLDIGVSVLRHTHETAGLAVPVLVYFTHDPRLAGSAARAEYKARRMMTAIIARYGALASRKKLFVQAALRAADSADLRIIDPAREALESLEEYA